MKLKLGRPERKKKSRVQDKQSSVNNGVQKNACMGRDVLNRKCPPVALFSASVRCFYCSEIAACFELVLLL